MITLSGVVEEGKKRGKKLGFPTANITPDKKANEGIYISRTIIDNKVFGSLTFIGVAVTFGETKVKAESYIIDFDEKIYNKLIKIELLKKIRENRKFETLEELIKQMELDKKEALEYFNKNV